MLTNPKLSCQIISACIIVYVVFHLIAGSIIHYHSILLEQHKHRTNDRTNDNRLEHPLQQIIKNSTANTMTYYEFHSEYYDPYDLYI